MHIFRVRRELEYGEGSGDQDKELSGLKETTLRGKEDMSEI